MNEQTGIIADYLFKVKLRKSFDLIYKKYKNKKIVLYGAAEMLSKMQEYCQMSKLNIIALCDEKFVENNNFENTDIYGYNTCTVKELSTLDFDCILVSLYTPNKVIKYLKKCFPKHDVVPVIHHSFIDSLKLLFKPESLYINYYIPIFLASDDNYAPFLAVTAYSVLQNTDSKIQFYIIDAGISDKNKTLIEESLVRFDNYTIEYIPFPQLPENSPLLKHPLYNKVAFAKFFVPQLKPNLIKALYLDVDIVVRKDITDLFMQKLNGFPLAAVCEDFQPYPFPGCGMLKKDCPEYNLLSEYFNDGVLLYDVQEFLQQNFTDKLIDIAEKYSDISPFADQCMFNILFGNNYKKIDYGMNYMPVADKFYKQHLKSDYAKTKKNAMIYHYTNQYCLNAPLFAGDFWKTAKKLPFYKELRSRANKILFDKIKTIFNIN